MKDLKWFDLTHKVSTRTRPYPGDPGLYIDRNKKSGPDDFVVSTVHAGMHLGTHADGFSHLLAVGAAISDIPLPAFFGRAIMIRTNPENGLIKTEAIDKKLVGKQKDADILIINTGWSDLFDSLAFYDECPGFEPDFPRLLDGYNIRLLGVDLPTVKFDASGNAPMHRALFEREIPVVESLRLSDDLPEYFRFFALPLLVEGIEASPVRAMAVISD